jgi:hypothetical protein
MKHVQKGGTSFFSYINSGDEAGGDGGESLTHRLFKEAIASASKTELRLGKFGNHQVTLSDGETEKPIKVSDGAYYADAYCRFQSDTSLAVKWAGEIYIEVHKSHLVPVEKIEELRQLSVPVIEVTVPDLFEYPHSEQHTTDELEAAHVEKIKNILEKGFLAGTVISDPSSPDYLKRRLAWEVQERGKTNQALLALQTELADMKKQLSSAKVQAELSASRERTSREEISELEKKHSKRQRDLDETIQKFRGMLTARNETIDNLKWWIKILAIGLAATAAVLWIVW